MFTFDSKELFPINIDMLIDMKVYDRKNNCKSKLTKNFILDTEFKVQKAAPELSAAAFYVQKAAAAESSAAAFYVQKGTNVDKGGAGKNKENIMLTVDCFKSMCMLSNSEIGKQVKNYYLDLEKIFKQYIILEFQEKQLQLTQLEQKTEKLQSTVENVTSENLTLRKNFFHLGKVHDELRLKRNYHKFKRGNCVYIITDDWREKNYMKIGFTDNINKRLETYRTSMPACKIYFLVYLTDNKLLEQCIKTKYAKELIQKNHEYVLNITGDILVEGVKSLITTLNLNVTYENTLVLYNEPYNINNTVSKDEIVNNPPEVEVKEHVNNQPEVEVKNIVNNPPEVEVKNIVNNPPEVEVKNIVNKPPEVEVKDIVNKPPEVEVKDIVNNPPEVKAKIVRPDIKCEWCEKTYKTAGKLATHMKKEHDKILENDTTKCPICQKEFSNKGKRDRHVKSLHDNSIPKVMCTECKKEFSSQDSLVYHINNVHKKLSQSKCHLCDKVISSTGNLKKHIKEFHEKSSKVVCNICQKEFINQNNLSGHILKIHNRIEKTPCTICQKIFMSKGGLQYHMLTIHKI